MRKLALTALSGGLDSTVLLSQLLKEGHDVVPVSFNYGSKHNPYEIQAARDVCDHYGLGERLTMFNIASVVGMFKSALLESSFQPLPIGHYEEESMRQTVVPGRNMIFISILAGLCESMGGGMVALGVHAGDHFIYPDCRPRFIESARWAVGESSDYKVSIHTPFISCAKKELVRIGLENNAPLNLTRTCYAGQKIACGKCGSCQERLEAFAMNGVPDPIAYECREIIPKT